MKFLLNLVTFLFGLALLFIIAWATYRYKFVRLIWWFGYLLVWMGRMLLGGSISIYRLWSEQTLLVAALGSAVVIAVLGAISGLWLLAAVPFFKATRDYMKRET